jgi:protein TonB
VATLSPSSEAYLHNPKPPYPVMSRRLGESGNVIVRALFGPDGRVLEARLQRSSGFERLDRSALETVRNDWRYSMPEWRDIPVSFSLKQPGEQ